MRLIEINITITTDNTTAALQAWETLTRICAGFAFAGIHAEASIDRINDTDLDDDEDEDEHADTDQQHHPDD